MSRTSLARCTPIYLHPTCRYQRSTDKTLFSLYFCTQTGIACIKKEWNKSNLNLTKCNTSKHSVRQSNPAFAYRGKYMRRNSHYTNTEVLKIVLLEVKSSSFGTPGSSRSVEDVFIILEMGILCYRTSDIQSPPKTCPPPSPREKGVKS